MLNAHDAAVTPDCTICAAPSAGTIRYPEPYAGGGGRVYLIFCKGCADRKDGNSK